jgi:hypothetical protein
MGRFDFQVPSESEAVEMLTIETRQAEFWADRVAAVRRMTPVTTRAERDAAKAFSLETAAVMGCTACGRFAFARPMVCFWCRTNTRIL